MTKLMLEARIAKELEKVKENAVIEGYVFAVDHGDGHAFGVEANSVQIGFNLVMGTLEDYLTIQNQGVDYIVNPEILDFCIRSLVDNVIERRRTGDCIPC
jgi:hypothetical protein